MVPDGVRALEDELRRANSTLESAGNELWSLLRHAGLATTHADTIRRIAGWAEQQIPDIHRRVVLLERLVAHDPAVQAGQPVFVNSELFAPANAPHGRRFLGPPRPTGAGPFRPGPELWQPRG